jgi:hypothetical protein
MAYLLERKGRTIFVTATSIVSKGKSRKITIENLPEYAIVQISGVSEKLPVPWEEIYALACKRHQQNQRLEQRQIRRTVRSQKSPMPS